MLLRPSENICGYWSVNSGDSSYCRFSELLPFGTPSLRNQPFFKALPQNCLFNLHGSCRFERSMYAGHEAAIHIKMCAASKRVANLRVSRQLSPKGGAWAPFAPPPPPPPPGSAPGLASSYYSSDLLPGT